MVQVGIHNRKQTDGSRRNRVDKMSFEDWFNVLTLLANQYYGDADLVNGDWIDFYNDDYTPEEALEEDLSYV